MLINLLRISLGSLLLLLGLIGLVLPVLQGGLFLILGLLLLSPNVPAFARLLCWIEERFPRLQSTVRRMRKFVDRMGMGTQPCASAPAEKSRE